MVSFTLTQGDSVILEIFSNLNNSLTLRQSATVQIRVGRERGFFHVSVIVVGIKCSSSQLQTREGKKYRENLGTAHFHPVEVPKELGGETMQVLTQGYRIPDLWSICSLCYTTLR